MPKQITQNITILVAHFSIGIGNWELLCTLTYMYTCAIVICEYIYIYTVYIYYIYIYIYI